MEIPEIEGYQTKIIEEGKNAITFRINVKNEDEFITWKHKYFYKTSTNFNIKYSHRQTRKAIFSQTLTCHHGSRVRSRDATQRITRTRFILHV